MVTIDELVNSVRIAIDENTTADNIPDLEYDNDILEMEDIIRSKVCEGINSVRLVAPVKYVKVQVVNREGVHNYEDESILTIALEGEEETEEGETESYNYDILRIISARANDWQRPCTDIISMDEDRYEQLHSRFHGVGGNWSRPVIAFGNDAQGRKVLEVYRTNDDEVAVQYVPKLTSIGNELEIEPPLYAAIVYKIAALVYATYNNEGSRVMDTLCMQELGYNTQK